MMKSVSQLANRFFKNNYDIKDLLTGMFTSSGFTIQKILATRLNLRYCGWWESAGSCPWNLQNPGVQLVLERLLGQVLFSPPNVAGWPGGKHWIDSSSLMLRMQLPKVIDQSDVIMTRPKDDDDLMMGMRDPEFPKNLKKLKNPSLAMFQMQNSLGSLPAEFQRCH